MRVTGSSRIGELGLLTLERWCVDRRWPLVRVPVERDLGIDGFVQVTDQDGVATGDLFGVQVKAGKSYLRRGGAAVPVGGHDRLWRDAGVPVIVVVHDPETGVLWWGNATETLRATPAVRSIRADAVLPVEGEDATPLLRSIRLTTDFRLGLPRGLGSIDPEEEREAVWQAFALGFAAPNALVALRRTIAHLSARASVEAVVALSHCTPHPDIFWTKGNLLPTEHRRAVAATFRWRADEVAHLLRTIDEDGIDRGSVGQCVYMLLYEDPDCGALLCRTAVDLVVTEPEIAGWAAYLAVAHADSQKVTWEELVAAAPLLQQTFVGGYLDEAFAEGWGVSLD